MTTTIAKFKNAVELQEELVRRGRGGAPIEVGRRGVAVVTVSLNAYKRGFALNVRTPDGACYAVAGCTRARDVNLDVMIGKGYRYIDEYLNGGVA